MTQEIHWLVLTILLTTIMWLPYIANRLFEQGILSALWDPNGETATRVKWAQRMRAAHTNAVENLVVFAPLVLILNSLNISTDVTVMACSLFFYSRLAHVIVFTFKVPVLRIATFLSGFAAQMMLIASVLNWI